MPSAANCRGISHCLESGHPVNHTVLYHTLGTMGTWKMAVEMLVCMCLSLAAGSSVDKEAVGDLQHL